LDFSFPNLFFFFLPHNLPARHDYCLARQPKTYNLFFRLFMLSLFLAPFAKLLELYFSLNFLFIFSTPVIYSFAISAGKFYQLNLFHFDLIVYL